MAQQLDREQIKTTLDNILPEYKRISEAPTVSDLARYADKYKKDLEWVISKEREQLYKSCNAQGDIYLIQNPAVWMFECQASMNGNPMGIATRRRPEPQKVNEIGGRVPKQISRKQQLLESF